MFRIGSVVAVAALVGWLLSASYLSDDTNAQGERDELAGHPVVGSWVVNDQSGIWPTAYVMVTFHDDGTVLATDASGGAWHGAWVASGKRSAEYAFISLGADGTARAARKFYARADVEEPGNAWVEDREATGHDSYSGVRITTARSFVEVPPIYLTPIASPSST